MKERQQINTEKKRIRSSFVKLDFDEDKHVYFVDNKPLKASVSKLIKQFYKPFLSKKKAKEIVQGNLQTGSINKYSGMSEREILAQWKEINEEALERGNRVHEFGERYPFNKKLKPICNQEKAVVKFWEELPSHIYPVMLEYRMYHFDKMFGGTADIILFDTKKGQYIIADYKTNNDLFKNYKEKKMLNPFEDLLDCPFSHYELQLSYYQIMLEQISVKVDKRIIIHLLKDGNYKLYNSRDFTTRINNTLYSKAA